ncbi:MAG: LysR family transcriptional regulator [Alphaproteobacteria bacterium]|nr:LysR family transcriptional regulator [Alphaproteobacteria bacterium]
MHNFWANMPSPRHLIVFEAAARLGSFTLAAAELRMQQPSVSAAIKQLEADLKIVLFYRSHRKVQLTSAGERLFAGVSAGLAGMENSIKAVQEMVRQEHVTLSTSSAFSYYWMMPRMTLLRETHPDIDLRVQNSDREPDLDVENISLGIRLGHGDWRGCMSAKIADEIIYPVANPMVMRAATNLRSIPNLLNQRLIHLEEPIRERPTWADWFRHHRIDNRDLHGGLRLNDYALVLQAAVSGEGFAIGWDHIVGNMLDRGVLAARQDWRWVTGRGVYLVWSQNKPLSRQARQVRDWMIDLSRSG